MRYSNGRRLWPLEVRFLPERATVAELNPHQRPPMSAAGSAQALADLVAKLGSDRVALAEILDSLAEAVTIRDRNGEIAYANRAATQRMGFSSREELLGQGTQGILGEYIVTDDQDLPITAAAIPSV